MAVRPQAGQSQIYHMPIIQEAGGQENGVFFPGSRTNLQWAGNLDLHRASSLPLRLSAPPCPTHTGAAMGGTPSSLSFLPHPNRLGLRVRKLEPMNPDSTFKGSISLTHHREPLGHVPYHRAPCFPLCSRYTTLALPLSFHASSVPTGAGGMESTEMLLPLSGSQASRRDGHRI